MLNLRSLRCMIALVFAVAIKFETLAQFTIDNITDKANYNDSTWFRVPTQAGFTYSVLLDGNPVSAGVSNYINAVDYHEVSATRTETATGAVTNRLVRFLVVASERAGTEWGLPPHVPFPVINSSSNEFIGGRIRLIAPSSFPTGYDIPVVAWIVNDQGRALRVNGLLAASGHPSIALKRGVGSGFLAATNPAGALNYTPQIGGLTTNKTIALQSNTTWTTVSGVLPASTSWPADSRIQVTGSLTVTNGGTLTISAGTIIRINAGLDITNNGTVIINGTVDQPVVFMPNSRTQPWGGFVSKATGAGVMQGTGAIFTGSGANPNWFGSGGNPGSHRTEQGLFYCDGGQQITLTDAAAIYLNGQLGHARQSGAPTSFNLTRFLMQRTTTGGEYTGGRFTANDSAFIECPDDSVNFVDGDNDGIYLVDGTHAFTNTLFGWTKDDGIDSGGDGLGRLHYENCWFESTFHEGNSLSGLKFTTSHGTVYFDCGQGIEDGYGAGSGGPTGRLDHCLFVANEIGVRHGDNYPSIGNGYPGNIAVTDSILLHNHRDVFGYNWRTTGWTNAVGQMFITNNFLTAANPDFPSNAVWNPGADGGRLAEFGASGRVGVGFATRAGQSIGNSVSGIPIGLSRFCTNQVSVNYSIATEQGTFSAGTLIFPPGLTRRTIPLSNLSNTIVRVALSSPSNAEITSASSLYLQNQTGSGASNVTLVATGSVWKYLDTGVDQGTAWRALNFNDAAWKSGPAELGFGDTDEATVISNVLQITTYFRRTFTVSDPGTIGSLALTLKRDDAGVVYINGTEVFRSPNLPTGTISYGTLAPVTGENSIDTATLSPTVLQPGTNILAVEIHQQSATSSDVSFDLSLAAAPTPRLNFTWLGTDFVNYWQAAGFALEEADAVTGPWRTVSTNSPVAAPLSGNRFFRLKK